MHNLAEKEKKKVVPAGKVDTIRQHLRDTSEKPGDLSATIMRPAHLRAFVDVDEPPTSPKIAPIRRTKSAEGFFERKAPENSKSFGKAGKIKFAPSRTKSVNGSTSVASIDKSASSKGRTVKSVQKKKAALVRQLSASRNKLLGDQSKTDSMGHVVQKPITRREVERGKLKRSLSSERRALVQERVTQYAG